MLTLNTALEDLAIISLQSEDVVGLLNSPIIDPRKLKLVAFYCSGPNIDKNSVLHTTDIREYQTDSILVNSADVVMPLSIELVRLQEVISLQFSIVGKMVIDNLGQKLGKVESYAVETDSFNIMQLRVSQSFFKNFKEAGPLIYRQQIIEVTDHYIVVKAPDISAKTHRRRSLSQIISPPKRAASSGQAKSIIPDSATDHR